jgi:hypothetical protein
MIVRPLLAGDHDEIGIVIVIVIEALEWVHQEMLATHIPFVSLHFPLPLDQHHHHRCSEKMFDANLLTRRIATQWHLERQAGMLIKTRPVFMCFWKASILAQIKALSIVNG